MLGENIFLFCLGIYLLISFYLIRFKKKLFLILIGSTYKKTKYIINRSKIDKELSFITFIFGIIFISLAIIKSFINTLFMDYVTSILFIIFIFNICVIVRNINLGYYNK